MAGDPATGMYDDSLRSFLAGQPQIISASQVTSCALSALQQYDVIVLWDSMICFDKSAFDSYVNAGGGIVGTGGLFFAYATILDSLPVSPSPNPTISMTQGAPNFTATDPNDVLLQGVTFPGPSMDVASYEFSYQVLRAGAVGPLHGPISVNELVISRMAYGQGRSIYTSLQYVDPPFNPLMYGWGQQLIRTAILWAGKLK